MFWAQVHWMPGFGVRADIYPTFRSFLAPTFESLLHSSYFQVMSWPKRTLICLIGFAVGFSAMAVWYYLNWASFQSAIFAGIGTAVLFGIGFSAPDTIPKLLRVSALSLLVLSFLVYSFYVHSILRVSDCGFIDGRLYCLNRYF